ncbi:MAG: DNA topoisomerase I [Candidatus Woesearchaeota archaeon]
MSYELIITEKPKSALKIAQALDGKLEKKEEKGVPYYKLRRDSKEIVITSAVGHLYGIAEKNPQKWKYPVFDVEWKPAYEIKKNAEHTKKYIEAIKKLAKNADSFTVATDYDIEGEVIGYNVIRFACNQSNASRMKFSTLTKPDLLKSYEQKSKTIDMGMAKAGEVRHELDWYWGINISRALTISMKSSGLFKILSAGRVQGPALKIIVEREREIKRFKPIPYWEIELIGDINGAIISSWHSNGKFEEKEKALEVLEKTKERNGIIKEIERKKISYAPPSPFDLTTLQTEAYSCFKISPKNTLVIAQNLYTEGLISYPRTSSQILPKEIGYSDIIKSLSSQDEYNNLCLQLLQKKKLEPNNGKKSDPAHPAIYPTGIAPKNLDVNEKKIYDLIVKRFLATFSDNAIRETLTIKIDINSEIFVAKGTTTIKKGWHIFYEPYVNLKEEILPNVKEGMEVKVKEIKIHDKLTQPPKRYTPASIIRELEKKNLGTKATRATIIDTLFNRGYIRGESIEATELGIRTVETLEKFCPKILDEELTRHFEVELEEIQENKKKPEQVLNEAMKVLTAILEDLKKKEKSIGEHLREAHNETKRAENIIGKCPVCNIGNLRIIKSKSSGKRFIACDKYPDCKTTFSIPQKGVVKKLKNLCADCGYPLVNVVIKGKRPWRLCINPECPAKKTKNNNNYAI